MILAALTLAMHLRSSTFAPNATMPDSTVYARCGGANVSPALRWSGVPRNAKSLALIVHDPDAPAPGGWYHWVVYDLPPSTRVLPAGVALPQRELGITSFRAKGYGGPCPPPGPAHHYVFTLYALDVARIGGGVPDGPQLLSRMRGHILAQGTLTGLYAR